MFVRIPKRMVASDEFSPAFGDLSIGKVIDALNTSKITIRQPQVEWYRSNRFILIRDDILMTHKERSCTGLAFLCDTAIELLFLNVL